MASIAVFSTTSNSVTLYLTGLDGKWEGGTRTMYWYLRKNNTPTLADYDFRSNGIALIANSKNESNAVEMSGLSPGTEYGVMCKVYYGSTELATLTGSVSTDEDVSEPVATRPNNFYWTYDKVQSGDFNLTAKEWNALTARINEFRAYKNSDSYSFDTAYKGYEFTADMYMQAREAIRDISGYGLYIPTVSSGSAVTAYAMDMVVSELNAIP